MFGLPLTADSNQAKAIKKAIGVLIAADMRPHSVIENTELKRMVKMLVADNCVPLCVHFSQSVVQPCINKCILQFRDY